MTTQPALQSVDTNDILRQEKAMRVRNALLELLRAWCEIEGLPQPVASKAEQPRRTDISIHSGHHKR